MTKTARPVVNRPLPDLSLSERFPGVDPIHARLFAMRGVKSADELDYGLAKLAPVGSLDNIDAAAELVIANRDTADHHRR